jgi:hypothetical protein
LKIVLCTLGTDPNGREIQIFRQHGNRSRQNEIDGRAGSGFGFARFGFARFSGSRRKGETLIDRVYHIDRGYENIVKNFRFTKTPSASPLTTSARKRRRTF